jgi:hypothetical protein
MENKRMTAMQLMLKYLEDSGLERTGAWYKANHYIGLEREQITETYDKAYMDGYEDNGLDGNDYYNKTYNG